MRWRAVALRSHNSIINYAASSGSSPSIVEIARAPIVANSDEKTRPPARSARARPRGKISRLLRFAVRLHLLVAIDGDLLVSDEALAHLAATRAATSDAARQRRRRWRA
jgi:hypothetical protein